MTGHFAPARGPCGRLGHTRRSGAKGAHSGWSHHRSATHRRRAAVVVHALCSAAMKMRSDGGTRIGRYRAYRASRPPCRRHLCRFDVVPDAPVMSHCVTSTKKSNDVPVQPDAVALNPRTAADAASAEAARARVVRILIFRCGGNKKRCCRRRCACAGGDDRKARWGPVQVPGPWQGTITKQRRGSSSHAMPCAFGTVAAPATQTLRGWCG